MKKLMFAAMAGALLLSASTTATLAAGKTIAWLGPCIGPQVFEVGDEVKLAFEAQHAQAASMFQPLSPTPRYSCG